MSFVQNFENSQIKQWIPHYISYRKINGLILSILNEYEFDKKSEFLPENNSIHIERRGSLPSSSSEIKPNRVNDLNISTDPEDNKFNSIDKKEYQVSNFLSQIDEEKKKVYLFYLEKEKFIFNSISLCIKEKVSYNYKTINELQNEIDNLEYLSELLKEVGVFVYENLNALKKLLKTFDKKLGKYLGKIYYSYFKDSFKKESSDLNYILNYKIIDEASVMIQELTEEVVQISFNIIKSNNNDNINMNEFTNSLKLSKGQIMLNLIAINENYNKLYSLFINFTKYIKLNKVNLLFEKENVISIEGQSMALDESLSLFEEKSKTSRDEISLFQKHHFCYSKENKANIFFIFFHTFIYMFLFSAEIPTVILFSFQKGRPSFLGWIFLMTPIGVLLSYLISHFFHHRAYKLPLLLSSFFIFAHCGLFISLIIIKEVWILMISQGCLGIGSNKVLNKLYLNNYIPKEKEKFSKYLKYFSMGGLSLGLVLSSFLQYYNPVSFDLISTFPSFLLAFLFQCIIFVVYFFWFWFIVAKFSEPLGKQFEIYHENIFDKEKLMDKPILGQQMINDISKANTKFYQINNKEQYIDLNLPEKFLNKIVNVDKKTKNYFLKLFITFLFIKLSVKYTNEMLFIYTPISFYESNDNQAKITIFIVNSFSYLISYLIAFYYSNFGFFKSRKTLICLLVFSIGITFTLGKYADYSIYKEVMLTGTFCLMFLVNVLDVLSVNLFSKIIPNNFMFGGKINGSTLINALIEYIKTLVYILIIAFLSPDFTPFITTNIMIFTSTLLLLVSLILSIIFYKQMKTLSITRVMNQMN